MLEVVAAIIEKEGKLLIGQRPAHKGGGLLWEFVGGKVEKGETKEDALIRECREELGVSVELGGVFEEATYLYPDNTIHLTFFWARITEGTPHPYQQTQLRWVFPKELSDYEFCHTNGEIIEKLQKKRLTHVRRFVMRKDLFHLIRQPSVATFPSRGRHERSTPKASP